MKNSNSDDQKQAQLFINDITDTSRKRIVYSIGHSNVSLAGFAKRLVAYKIDRVIDVRTKPYSRWCPQFNKDQLAYALAELDINYDWRGSSMGGKAVNVGYDEAIQWVFDRAEYENIVVMCSEGNYRKCHRFTMLTPSFEALGAEIVHISYR